MRDLAYSLHSLFTFPKWHKLKAWRYKKHLRKEITQHNTVATATKSRKKLKEHWFICKRCVVKGKTDYFFFCTCVITELQKKQLRKCSWKLVRNRLRVAAEDNHLLCEGNVRWRGTRQTKARVRPRKRVKQSLIKATTQGAKMSVKRKRAKQLPGTYKRKPGAMVLRSSKGRRDDYLLLVVIEMQLIVLGKK